MNKKMQLKVLMKKIKIESICLINRNCYLLLNVELFATVQAVSSTLAMTEQTTYINKMSFIIKLWLFYSIELIATFQNL